MPTTIPSKQRLESIDWLRGFVMVVMALDHVRDHFTSTGLNPTDLTKVGPALFITRWITHFCAPTFIFLAGMAVFLSESRGKSRVEMSRFLMIRGLLLAILELTVERFGWTFNCTNIIL